MNPRAPLVVALAALLLAAPSAGRAEEPVWTFEVREVVEHGETSHEIRLTPAPPGVDYPRTCAEFVIRANLEPGRGVPVRLTRYFDKLGYAVAIQKIRQAKSRGELLRVGSIDRGFGLGDPEKECEVESHGLGLLLDRDKQGTVFSVY